MADPAPKPTKGYGKRSAKQWIIIYVVVAAIVYALIYFLFMRDGDSSGGTFSY